MKTQSSKLTAILIAALMLVSIGTALISTTTAATTLDTYAFITTAPHTVGVGQKITIYFWVDKIFPSAGMANDYRFHDWKLVITLPDNTTETKTFETIADTTSNQGYGYTPTQVGTYQATFYFPETYVNKTSHNSALASANDVYKAANATCTFTVQEEPISSYPGSYPLPTEYWTRPIYGENPDWYTISSNWLGTGAPGYLWNSINLGGNGQIYPTDAVGSLTNHIMWTKSLQSGGVVGGDLFDIKGNTYFDGSAYFVRYENPIVVNGYIYYTEPLSYTAKAGGDTVCVDLRTGAEIWRSSELGWSGALSFALIWDAENPNQHGVYNALLVATSGSTWRFYDADTGKALFNATNVPSGAKAAGPNNEYVIYVTQNTTDGWTISQWNSTNLWSQGGTGTTANTGTVNANTAARFNWANVSITYNGREFLSRSQSFRVLSAQYGDYLLCMNGTFPSTGTNSFIGSTTPINDPYTYFLVNLNESKGDIGRVMWYNTIQQSKNETIVWSGVDTTNRVFVENVREEIYWVGYSLDTGKQIWTTEEYPQTAMDYYGSQASGSLSNSYYNGRMYSAAYGGIVYCYDTTDGSLLWTYGNGGEGNSTDSGFEVPGNYPTFISGYGQDVVYTVTSEHTIQTPIYKGAVARAINATTGEEIWKLSSYCNEFTAPVYALADGYNTWFNGYDNSIYVVGRGPSKTTVSAPGESITFGKSLVITGTVTDISAGASQNEVAARFPNGLPVSSDASMENWMGYVYQDKPAPTDFSGVEVTINVIDANGNYRTIGTTTTDINGFYSLQWTPDIEGKYTVIANFAGTNGYWPSKAVTAFAVDEAAATPTPVPTQAPSAADLYFIPAVAALAIIMVVIGLAIIMIMKKHP